MDLSSLAPITMDSQQADPICGCKNAGKTTPGGSEFESSPIEAPTSFAASIEEALRRVQVSDKAQVTQEGKAAPILSLDQPAQQDFGLSFLPPFPRTEAETLEDSATASSASTPENGVPNPGVAFLACAPPEAAIPVSGAASRSLGPTCVTPEHASTAPLEAPAGPAVSFAQGSETPLVSPSLARGEEFPTAVVSLAREDTISESSGSTPAAGRMDLPTSSGLSPVRNEGEEQVATAPAGSQKTAVSRGDLCAQAKGPTLEPGFATSLTMTSETLRQEPSCVPQNEILAPAVARAATQEPSRPLPYDPSTPGVPGPQATPKEDTPAVFSFLVSSVGKTPNAESDAGGMQKNSAGLPREPAPPQESPLSSDPEEAVDDAFEDGRPTDKSATPQSASDVGPLASTRSALQGRERSLPQAPGGTEDTGALQQTGTRTAEAPHGAPVGTGKSVSTAGLATGESFASHLQLRAREALESSTKQFHLRIEADGLGDMRWDVRLEPGKIAAQALVDTPRLQEMVRAQQEALVQRFQELGLEVESFEVLVNSGSTGDRSQGRQAPESDHSPRMEGSQASLTRSPIRLVRSTGQGLDLFV